MLWKIAGGIGFGLLVGQALGYVIFHYVERSPSLEAGDALVAFGITLLAYGVAGWRTPTPTVTRRCSA